MADEAVAKQFDAVWGIAHPILDATIASLPAGAPTSTLQAWWAGANRTQGEVAKRLLAAALTFVQFLCLYYAYSWVLISVVLASLAPDEMAKGFKFIEGQVRGPTSMNSSLPTRAPACADATCAPARWASSLPRSPWTLGRARWSSSRLFSSLWRRWICWGSVRPTKPPPRSC
jgi:hypothetical protein